MAALCWPHPHRTGIMPWTPTYPYCKGRRQKYHAETRVVSTIIEARHLLLARVALSMSRISRA